jgi:hypothetical protein
MTAEDEGKPWTDDDLQTLKTLITENTPTRLIAMKLAESRTVFATK